MISLQLTNGSGAPPYDSAGDILILFLQTSFLLIVANLALGGDAAMAIAAAKLYGVVLLLLGSAALVWRRTGSVEISALFLPVYLGVVLAVGSPWLVLPLVAASLVFLETLAIGRTARALFAVRGAIAAAIAVALVMSFTHYSDFLIMEKLWYGDVHQDTLFHAAISAMIKTYGVASTGLQGLVPVHYHILSHQGFAALSILSGVHVLEVYRHRPYCLHHPPDVLRRGLVRVEAVEPGVPGDGPSLLPCRLCASADWAEPPAIREGRGMRWLFMGRRLYAGGGLSGAGPSVAREPKSHGVGGRPGWHVDGRRRLVEGQFGE